MDFQTAVRTCFQKYATFQGRAPRSEFWWFALFCFVGSLLAGMLDRAALGLGMLELVFSLAIFLPSLAVSVRRLHDVDRSGWWYLLIFVPIVGWIVLLVWFVQPGTSGSNQFGPDPLGAALA